MRENLLEFSHTRSEITSIKKVFYSIFAREKQFSGLEKLLNRISNDNLKKIRVLLISFKPERRMT